MDPVEVRNDKVNLILNREERQMKLILHIYSLLLQRIKKLVSISRRKNCIKVQHDTMNCLQGAMDSLKQESNTNSGSIWTTIHLLNRCLGEQIQYAYNHTMGYQSLNELIGLLYSWSEEMNFHWRERQFSGVYEEALEISGLIQNTRNHYLSCWDKINQLIEIQLQIVRVSLDPNYHPSTNARLLYKCQANKINLTRKDKFYPQRKSNNTVFLNDVIIDNNRYYCTQQDNFISSNQFTNNANCNSINTTNKSTFFSSLFNKRKKIGLEVNLKSFTKGNITPRQYQWLKAIEIPDIMMLSRELDEIFLNFLTNTQFQLLNTWLFDESTIELVLLKFITKIFTQWNSLQFITRIPTRWNRRRQSIYTFLKTTENIFSVEIGSTLEFQEFLHEIHLLWLGLLHPNKMNSITVQYNYDESISQNTDVKTFYYQEKELENLIHEYQKFIQLCNLCKLQVLNNRDKQRVPLDRFVYSSEKKSSSNNVAKPVVEEMMSTCSTVNADNLVHREDLKNSLPFSKLFNRYSQLRGPKMNLPFWNNESTTYSSVNDNMNDLRRNYNVISFDEESFPELNTGDDNKGHNRTTVSIVVNKDKRNRLLTTMDSNNVATVESCNLLVDNLISCKKDYQLDKKPENTQSVVKASKSVQSKRYPMFDKNNSQHIDTENLNLKGNNTNTNKDDNEGDNISEIIFTSSVEQYISPLLSLNGINYSRE
ncbi:unnamed protein product [Heterobilharzia americana]|nr:unnamed protein product [Heterobilharzia americana]